MLQKNQAHVWLVSYRLAFLSDPDLKVTQKLPYPLFLRSLNSSTLGMFRALREGEPITNLLIIHSQGIYNGKFPPHYYDRHR